MTHAEAAVADADASAPLVRVTGVELVDGMRGTLLTTCGGDDVHIVANPTIDVDGDRATADSMWIYVVRGEGDVPVISKIGSYHEVFTREDGRWRFRRREAPTIIPAL